MSEIEYRNAYSALGEERLQEGIPLYLPEVVRRRRRGCLEYRPADEFWKFRRDDQWVGFPRKIVYNRTKRRTEVHYLINNFFVDLAPSNTFNPRTVWENTKRIEREQREKASQESSIAQNAVAVRGADRIRDVNTTERELRMQLAEITRIRNMSTTIEDLKSLLSSIKYRRSMEILLVEILSKVMSKTPLDRPEVLDVLWGIEALDTLTEEPAPPSDQRGSLRLVYDNYINVKNLVERAKAERRREEECIISFQLNEMSDRLPPLSQYARGGFKLDSWQRHALEFIDAGKSVVVCAPTSSGKTALSSYVALIDRSRPVAAGAAGASSAAAPVADELDELADDADSIDEGDISEDEEGLFNLRLDDARVREEYAHRMATQGLSDRRLREEDRTSRLLLRRRCSDGIQRVLFVVPTEPLALQVAGYFAKLLREEGDTVHRVGLVTNMLTYGHQHNTQFSTLPQIVVGTPFALESALSKPRGLVGQHETARRPVNDILAGGFDHFDWAVYDEVHALDGEEGDALQRLIRCMNCKFLALSATVGNAEELRSWMERVKGDQLVGVESVNVLPADAAYYGALQTFNQEAVAQAMRPEKATHQPPVGKTFVEVRRRVDGTVLKVTVDCPANTTVKQLQKSVHRMLPASEQPSVEFLCLRHTETATILRDREVQLDSFAFFDKTEPVLTLDLISCSVTILRPAIAGSHISINSLSPLSTIAEVQARIWHLLPADQRGCDDAAMLCLRPVQIVGARGQAPAAVSNTLEVLGASVVSDITVDVSLVLELTTIQVNVVRTVDRETAALAHVSPLATVLTLKKKIAEAWPYFNAESLQVIYHHRVGAPIPVLGVSRENGFKITVRTEDAAGFVKGRVLAIGNGFCKVVEVVSVAGESSSSTQIVVDYLAASVPEQTECFSTTAIIFSENKDTLFKYIPHFQGPNEPLADSMTIEIRSLVNMLTYQSRFINLQRYAWLNGKLEPINPIAAVGSVDQLRHGILDECSLSFTSRDSYRLWQMIEEIYPADAIVQLNPTVFFHTGERITLQRSKDYEDALKVGLKQLAERYPIETEELLYRFHLRDPEKNIDICELVLALKKSEMLPCLVFHLNPFEAIKIFKMLLSGMERRQKNDHPYWYNLELERYRRENDAHEQLIRDMGGNEKEAEEAARQQDAAVAPSAADLDAPHKHFKFCDLDCMTSQEFKDLSDEMERNDSFAKRDPSAMEGEGRGMNRGILTHALMRGLKRGIGLFINEVSAPSYRRAVQRLASQGKLAVVVSDDSLAFGVNMPFRTCLFCGEMNGALTPLMAQQMSGRAGRRGLDTQGNLVFAGSSASFIRQLMIGKVANITGERFPPKYDTVFLQGLLSTRHVGWNRLELLGGKSLDEFVSGKPLTEPSQSLEISKNSLIALDLIKESPDGSFVPANGYWETLSMVWELRYDVPVSICMASLLGAITAEVEARTRELLIIGQEEWREARQERMNQMVVFMLTFLFQICDRVAHTGPAESSLQHHPYFHNPKRRALFNRWSRLIRVQQSSIPEHLAHLRLPVPIVHDSTQSDLADPLALDPNYVLLDKTLFQCILPDNQNFIRDLSDQQKQDLKARVWKVGCILKTMGNTLWPRNEYFNTIGDSLHICFRNMYYLNTDLVRDRLSLTDVSAYDRETREERDRATAKLELRDELSSDPRRNPLVQWKDNDITEMSESRPVPFTVAAGTIVDSFL